MYVGRLLGRVSGDLSVDDPLTVDRYEIKHEECTLIRAADATEYRKHYYWFKKR